MDALLDVKIDFFKVSVMERKCDKMTRYENSMIRVTRYLAIDLIENNLKPDFNPSAISKNQLHVS